MIWAAVHLLFFSTSETKKMDSLHKNELQGFWRTKKWNNELSESMPDITDVLRERHQVHAGNDEAFHIFLEEPSESQQYIDLL